MKAHFKKRSETELKKFFQKNLTIDNMAKPSQAAKEDKPSEPAEPTKPQKKKSK
jgi:hypothetical protein